MRMNPNPPLRRSRVRALAIALALVVVAPPVLAAAEDPGVDVGQVAADPILALVDDDRVKVEINVGPSLLRMIAAGAANEDPALRDTIAGIRGIRTLILDIADVSGGDRVETTVNDLVRRLERSGWERTARIREDASNINVLIRADEEGLARGLVVLILEGDSNELVFVNLHGVLDLGRLAQIEGLEVPGLEHVPSENGK